MSLACSQRERGDAGITAMIGIWLILALVGISFKQHSADLTRCAKEASTGASVERQKHCWDEHGVFVPPVKRAK